MINIMFSRRCSFSIILKTSRQFFVFHNNFDIWTFDRCRFRQHWTATFPLLSINYYLTSEFKHCLDKTITLTFYCTTYTGWWLDQNYQVKSGMYSKEFRWRFWVYKWSYQNIITFYVTTLVIISMIIHLNKGC